MKNNVIILMFLLTCSPCTNAQSDGFFRYQYEYRDKENDEWSELLLLPNEHGLDYNYPSDAPLGTGLIILVGLGVCYVLLKNMGIDCAKYKELEI